MKKLTGLGVFLSVAGMCAMAQAVQADSTDATCEFYKHGDKKHDRWGTCSFSQRQGYVDIKLKNGDTYNLSPRSEANQYNDQKGNKVVRSQSGGNGEVYQWEEDNQKIVVTFNAGAASSAGSAAAAAPSTDKVDVNAMAKYCAGEASAKFQQRPTNISTQPAIEDQGMYSVFGQYPPSGADPTVFICTFSSDGKFVGVDKE